MTSLRPAPTLAFFGSLVLSLSAFGCTVHSPPAAPMPFDAPRTLDGGRTSIAVSGGVGSEVLGSHLSTGTVAVRRGLVDGVEGQASASVVHVQGDFAALDHRDIVSARAGAKVELGTHHVALIGGAGGGTWAGGAFVAPDLGVVVGYDNPYFIPYLAVRGVVSAPLSARTVDSSPAGWTGAPMTTRPTTSEYLDTSVGFRIPLGDQHSPGVAGALFGAATFSKVHGHDQDAAFLGVGGGGEVSF